MSYDMLFSPMKIGNCEIKNRIVMAPMLMGFGQLNGKATKQMMDYYEERAKGGTGLIITEITRIDDKTGAAAFKQLGISHDYQIKPLKQMADRIHSHGAKLFIELHHPGRQNLGLLIHTVPVSIGCNTVMPFFENLMYKFVPLGVKLMQKDLVPKVVCPSAVERSYFANSKNRELKKSEIKKIINEFIAGAVRVKKADCDGVELHATHGYLIQQFLSPFTNRRTDEYGGSLENRMRFLIEIVEGIKRECGKDFPLIVRLSADECYDRIGEKGKGYSLSDGVEMAKILEKAGVDAIDVSSASYDTFNYWLEPTSFELGWRKHMAAAIKNAVSIPIIAANLIRTPEQAERQLEEGVQDFIALGRPQIADPYWANKAMEGRADDIKRCICCLYCIESMQENAFIGSHGRCSVNPFVGKETFEFPKDGAGKTAVIIGAGVAGLMAAELMAKRGFKTVVLEKQSRVGGQMLLAAAPPHKEKLNWCVEDLYNAAVKSGVDFRMNTTADVDLVLSFNPYAVFIATGANALKPKNIKGSDRPNVFTSTDVLNGTADIKNSKVAVIGSGMTGLETAEFLCEKGNNVTVVEMADEIAPGTWMQHRDDILPRLNAFDVKFYTSYKLTAIHDDGIHIESTKTREVKGVEADYVVLALGSKSDKSIYEKLLTRTKRVFLIGDSDKVGRIANATASAFEAVKKV
jgi:2,4-dienoyl-CoA reductase-like NADH-dependent reductase (Old Yellow Enzyme family)/thioredoxin reductase